jgi:hypothetical protein
LRFFLLLTVLISAFPVLARQSDSTPALTVSVSSEDATVEEQPQPVSSHDTNSTQTDTTGQQSVPAQQSPVPLPPGQPKRILGLMPNYRAVSAGTIPPPPTPKQAFKIATRNSFD